LGRRAGGHAGMRGWALQAPALGGAGRRAPLHMQRLQPGRQPSGRTAATRLAGWLAGCCCKPGRAAGGACCWAAWRLGAACGFCSASAAAGCMLQSAHGGNAARPALKSLGSCCAPRPCRQPLPARREQPAAREQPIAPSDAAPLPRPVAPCMGAPFGARCRQRCCGGVASRLRSAGWPRLPPAGRPAAARAHVVQARSAIRLLIAPAAAAAGADPRASLRVRSVGCV
jgi:hypothetical protein